MVIVEYSHGLNSVPLPQMFVHPEPQNVALFGNRLFTKVMTLRQGCTGLRWALTPMGASLQEERAQRDSQTCRHIDRHTHKEEEHVKMKVETGGKPPETKEHWGQHKLGKARRDPLLEPSVVGHP